MTPRRFDAAVVPMPGVPVVPRALAARGYRLAVASSSALVVEDSRNGMLAAKAAGMACAVIPCDVSRHQLFTEADWILASMTDLETATRL